MTLNNAKEISGRLEPLLPEAGVSAVGLGVGFGVTTAGAAFTVTLSVSVSLKPKLFVTVTDTTKKPTSLNVTSGLIPIAPVDQV